jgi:hypothetical protein
VPLLSAFTPSGGWSRRFTNASTSQLGKRSLSSMDIELDAIGETSSAVD